MVLRDRIPKLEPAGGDVYGETAGPHPEHDARPGHAAPSPALRLAILGDSSAAGFGAPDHATALAGQMAEALAALSGRAVSWRVTARGGATARTAPLTLLPGLTDPATGWRPELVLVVVGVNDTTRLRRPALFHRDVSRLISAIRDHLGEPIPVLLAGLPPVHRFPALPAPVRFLLGRHARRLDRRLGALARQLPDTYHLPVGQLPMDRPGLFAPDGFHPAPAAYRVWGRLLAAQAADVLETA
ncbi:SGNH/GDSL hydrolase family protein [Actinoplanes aureus]|uniref:SGNH/GDSL hydrolase family protein n=1 Tax=Actinoplanes aureus TaxID=2792083 RepID=A0A931CC14_9ACTN|nr:SGNH/GDSL hydrolase family protein [Actinoplanes aureus]MBG0562135.1 SGNH/GDSL hydrolase family protein [Actinoplanes aureus]